MILLVTAIERRSECAAALEHALNQPVLLAEDLLEAMTVLRAESCAIVIFDEGIAQTEPAEMENTLDHLGTAIPVQVNLAISGSERLVREVRAAVRRRKYEETSAREAVAQTLRGELSGTLTTLLMDCELALETSGLSPQAMERLDAVHHAAQMLRFQLQEQKGT